MNAKKVTRKRRLVERLEHEAKLIAKGSRKTPYQRHLLKTGRSPDEALKMALERHEERLSEAKEGL